MLINDKSLAKAVLLVLLGFLGYLFYVFIPIWSYSLSNLEGTAKVISLSQSKLEYSYYNVSKNKVIKLKRELDKTTYFNKIKEADEFRIQYSKSFSGYVVSIGIDNQTPVFLTLIVICLTLIAIWLYVLVLKGRISLKTLLGIN